MKIFVITRTEGDYDLYHTLYESKESLFYYVEAMGMHKDYEAKDAAQLVEWGYLEYSEEEVRS